MSILIRGVGLPKSCHNCLCAVELFDYCDNTHSCECNILQKDTTNYSTGRREDCPLVEVPEHHGRLVDLDNLIDDMGLDKAQKYGNETTIDRAFSYGTLMRHEIAEVLEDTPVIIEWEQKVSVDASFGGAIWQETVIYICQRQERPMNFTRSYPQ